MDPREKTQSVPPKCTAVLHCAFEGPVHYNYKWGKWLLGNFITQVGFATAHRVWCFDTESFFADAVEDVQINELWDDRFMDLGYPSKFYRVQDARSIDGSSI